MIAIDPYACAVKAKQKYFHGWKAIGHIPREFLRYIHFFIKKKGGRISVNVKSLKCKQSPTPSGGLEVSLLLTFLCPEEWIRIKMKDFINNFCTYYSTGIIGDSSDDDSSHESDIEIDF